jgi:hypothetical protein
MAPAICPFRIGDRVIYRPSDSGYRYEQNSRSPRHLVPGECYEIAALRMGEWITLRGLEDRPDGWYWTEFQLLQLTGTSPRRP